MITPPAGPAAPQGRPPIVAGAAPAIADPDTATDTDTFDPYDPSTWDSPDEDEDSEVSTEEGEDDNPNIAPEPGDPERLPSPRQALSPRQA